MRNISFIIILIFLLFTGCTYKKNFKYDLPISKENSSYIQGYLKKNPLSTKPYYLLLYKIEAQQEKLVDFSTHINAEKFHFTVIPGIYRLYVLQEPEILSMKKEAFVFESQDIIIQKTTNCSTLSLDISMSSSPKKVEKFDLLIGSLKEQSLFDKIAFNQQITLNSPIFSASNAKMGLLSPQYFIENIGGGLYCINPFDNNKIPILFIHGMIGHPANFSKIIEHIDQDKFQILVYYYPTGANLNYTIDALKSKFDLLRQIYHYKKLYIIAHSMGGLVARGFINIYNTKLPIPIFISLATPWNGQKFAQLGGVSVGKIVPAFGNLYPGSAFQKKLYLNPLSKNIEHYLFFGYRGKKSLILDNSNDGVISLSSQLHTLVQKQSYKLYGYNLNHQEILKDNEVINDINHILTTHDLVEAQ